MSMRVRNRNKSTIVRMTLGKLAETEMNRAKVIQKLKFYWRFSSIFEVYCMLSTYHRVRQLISNTTCPFWSVWRMLHFASGQNCFPTIYGFRMMIMHRLIELKIMLDYLTKHQINTIEQPPYSRYLARATFSFSQNSNNLFRKKDKVFGIDKRQCSEKAESYIFMGL